ncbi:hypothetical protein BX589_101143 [Paraburkholderia fungorum]|jgi:hypothetical protein|nr:hypothetical protein BX589_101143 [Paraburkholderia fungorum]
MACAMRWVAGQVRATHCAPRPRPMRATQTITVCEPEPETQNNRLVAVASAFSER